MKRFLFCLFVGIIFIGLLVGCASKSSPSFSSEKLQQLVKQALSYCNNSQWDLAEQALKEIRDRYPDTPYALWAELKIADVKFFAHEYQEAIVLYQEFEKLHPTNEAMPYVFYQIGTCYYKLKLSPDRDQTFTKAAIEAYKRLLRKFPHNPYKKEVLKRIKECREYLARHELYVAQYYFKTKRYRGAYYRLLYALKTYPDTTSVQQAYSLVNEYYQKALEETQALAQGTLKDFWGQPVR